MTNALGSHVKFQVAEEHRERVQAFYTQVIGFTSVPSPVPNLSLWQTPQGAMLGVFFVPSAEALTEPQCLHGGTWLEIMTDDVEGLTARLREFGVKEIDYFDKAHFYFHSPGGPVFRVASEAERGH